MVSDHEQLNIVRALAINAVFHENGLIEENEAGNITDYTAFCKSSGLSAAVYLKNPADQAAYDRTYAVLNRLCSDGIYGISRVYTAEEAQREEHLAGGFSFVLETNGYTAFNNDWVRPILRQKGLSDYRYGNATHGHHPDKGPQPTLFAFGPDIRPGAVVEHARLVDEAPTIAQILDVRLDGADGSPLHEILR